MKPEKFPGDILRNWRRIDLRRRDTWPHESTLVVVRMEPKNGRATFYRGVRNEAGCFERDGGKLLWRGTSIRRYATDLKQHYELWWCYMPEFDGMPY